MNRHEYYKKLISISDEKDFTELALQVFHFQSKQNKIYSEFVKGLRISEEKISRINEIPFLPVEFFKSNVVLTGDESYERIFTSSGTTGSETSRHYIKDTLFYEQVFTKIFSSLYGSVSDYTILALLPSYLEREGSSLIYMMEKLILFSDSDVSGFYLTDFEKLFLVLNKLQQQKKKTILFGVTYALLDFAASFKINFPELIVMETGGMKGKRKEMVREEVHELLCSGFGVKVIHSEYGMTELLSQAYSQGNGIFTPPHWMRVLIRDIYDPLQSNGVKSTGVINIIDLANIDSCAFLSTQDLGRSYEDNSFEVLGRVDYSDIRGCNLLVE